jgi:type VI secretion system protein ImpH
MATASGTQDPDVIERTDAASEARFGEVLDLLETVPYEFDFFQTVRLFERIFPHRKPVGHKAVPSAEVMRFGSHASIVFPASAIQRIDWSTTLPPVIVVNFMGLTGPQGVLPLFYSQMIIERIRAKDTGMAAFFDIFNHRMISLFYRAWEKYRFAIAYERQDPEERDRVTHVLLHLIGIGTEGLTTRQAFPDEALLFYTGLLSLHPRSASALKNILWDYFDVPVEIEQFVGAWYRLDNSTQCEFARDSTSEQAGIGVIVGDEIWDQQSGVRIRLGPLSLKRYLDFLPNGTAYQPLKALARFFGGDGLDFEVQLVLKREEVPPCELGVDPESQHEAPGESAGMEPPVAPQLGWSTWAKTVIMKHDPSDTILRI